MSLLLNMLSRLVITFLPRSKCLLISLLQSLSAGYLCVCVCVCVYIYIYFFFFQLNEAEHVKHPGLISFRMDWLDLLAVQGTLTSLLQHHSSKASILWHSAFFRVQLSHPYITIGKIIALTRQTFVAETKMWLSGSS